MPISEGEIQKKKILLGPYSWPKYLTRPR